IDPGIYTSISVSNSATLTLNPGVYVITGSVSISGAATVNGTGVMLYVANSNYPNSGGSFGSITVNFSGTLNLTPAATGTYAGVAVFQARTNANPISIVGNAIVNLNGGLLYAAAAQLLVQNSAQLKNAAVVANKVNLSGVAKSLSAAALAPAATPQTSTPAASPASSAQPSTASSSRAAATLPTSAGGTSAGTTNATALSGAAGNQAPGANPLDNGLI